ncbi:MAG: ABC transporter permease [Bacillati bacterium ANGP1]|uniref:ABC transporter permease n=1 Tax=Candidatus Segetimicrobium genomatis TaxID=2569760 RepID=A0A537K0Z0_9BACT|nr:MAG: ABC transporter permease [Terrabacteria group bacterium ANGP1]
MAGSTLVFEAPRSAPRAPRASPVRRLLRSPSGAVGAALLAVLLATGFVGSMVTPYDPAAQNLDLTVHPPSLTPVRGAVHLLGTDQLGRDVFSRLLVGLRISLLVALAVVPLSTLAGLTVGMVTGYRGGWLDVALMRLVDAQLSIPTLLLTVAVVAVLGSGLLQIVGVLVIAGWPGYARVVRAEVLSLRDREFAAAARAVGASDVRILAQHVLPNVLPTVLVLATLHLPVVIVLEAALSFLGLGIQPPTPSLGQMLGYSQDLVWQAWWMPTIPGVAITVVVLAFNLLGDRMRDVLDPRLRGLGPV